MQKRTQNRARKLASPFQRLETLALHHVARLHSMSIKKRLLVRFFQTSCSYHGHSQSAPPQSGSGSFAPPGNSRSLRLSAVGSSLCGQWRSANLWACKKWQEERERHEDTEIQLLATDNLASMKCIKNSCWRLFVYWIFYSTLLNIVLRGPFI